MKEEKPAPMVIAIDGVAGAGKSTLAAALARALNLEYLDTGAMYRAIALAARRRGVSPADAEGLEAIAATVSLEVGETVVMEGEDVTAEIRSPEVNATVSQVAAHPGVRKRLVERQRRWVAERGGGVIEGRDIATVVFPDARLKLFLVAELEERGRRRHRQERAAHQAGAEKEVAAELGRRDEADSSRQVSPLRPAEGARILDTTSKGVDELVAEVVSWL